MNESAEEFRRITMKVLVMQLASTTIMDSGGIRRRWARALRLAD